MKADDSRIVRDPICGKDVDTLRARAVGIFGGTTYYFCSQECKAKFVDPRKEAAQAPPRDTGERRLVEAELPAKLSKAAAKAAKLEAAKLEAAKSEAAKSEAAADAGELPEATTDEAGLPVRYARSRMRRVTGEVSTPVVQIDLSPNKRASAPTPAADEDLEPARSGRGWAWVAIVMLILAGGVIFFTLKHR